MLPVRPGFARLATGPAIPSAPVPVVGASIIVRMGHRVRGVVMKVEAGEGVDASPRITCEYKGLADDPADMVRKVWIDAGANYGLQAGDTFTTWPSRIETTPPKPFRL